MASEIKADEPTIDVGSITFELLGEKHTVSGGIKISEVEIMLAQQLESCRDRVKCMFTSSPGTNPELQAELTTMRALVYLIRGLKTPASLHATRS